MTKRQFLKCISLLRDKSYTIEYIKFYYSPIVFYRNVRNIKSTTDNILFTHDIYVVAGYNEYGAFFKDKEVTESISYRDIRVLRVVQRIN